MKKISTTYFALLLLGLAANAQTTLVADPAYLTGDGSGTQTWDDGVTVKAYNLDGSLGRLVYDTQFADHGFGVAGARWDQIDFYANAEGGAQNVSERVEINFNGGVNDVILTVGMMGLNEGSNSQGYDETGQWKGYDAQGNLVAQGLLGPAQSALGADKKASGTYGRYPIPLTSSEPLYRIVIEATGFGNGEGAPRNESYGENNSDFNIMALSYERTTTDGGGETPNNPPVVADDDFFEIREDVGLTGIEYSTLLANDSDPDGDALRIVGFNFLGFPGEITDDTDQERILFTTSQDFNGEINIGYAVSDGQATTLGLITITIIQVLDEPTVRVDGPFTTPANTPLTISTADLLANDDDPDEGDVITFNAIESTQNGSATANNETVTFAPAPDFVGQASFTYSVISTTTIDNSQFTDVVTSEPIIVNVTSATDTSSISGSFVLKSKADADLTLQVNDTDNRTSAVVEACDDGQVWTVTEQNDGYYEIINNLANKALEAWRPSPSNGDNVTIYDANNKDWQRWELIAAGNGYYKIKGKYNPRLITLDNGNTIVADENGSDNQLWELVAPTSVDCDMPSTTNQSLAARNDSGFEATVGTPLSIPFSVVLANDSGPAGNALTVSEVTDPQNGTVSLSDQNIRFVPTAAGLGTFAYSITDGTGRFATGIVAISITPASDLSDPDPVMLSASALRSSGSAEQLWGECTTVLAQDGQGNSVGLGKKDGRVGVATGRYDFQLDYDAASATTERILVDFNREVRAVTIKIGNLEKAEYQELNETGYWIGYDAAGAVVAEGAIDPTLGASEGRGTYRFDLSTAGIHTLELGATAYGQGQGTARLDNNSDFSLLSVGFTPTVACGTSARQAARGAAKTEAASETLSIQAYPNPVVDQLRVVTPHPNTRWMIYNATGALVSTFATSTRGETVLEVDDLRSGTYLIRAVSAHGTQELRFVRK